MREPAPPKNRAIQHSKKNGSSLVRFPPVLGVLVYVWWVCSWSVGLVMLLVLCRHFLLYQVSIQVAMSRRAWSLVV